MLPSAALASTSIPAVTNSLTAVASPAPALATKASAVNGSDSCPSAARAAAGDCFENNAVSFVAESVNDAMPATTPAATITTATTGFSRKRAVRRSMRVFGASPPLIDVGPASCRQATARSMRSIAIRDFHAAGPVSWTDSPLASTATVTGMSATVNS